ncbi:DUF1329 domain-containing protein [Sphaerotilus sp.]|uniref:DUF1329 domain-containing protein n=1 Tax=Sphaerotilus sp. TaxID=2093942 RepID=UPI00286E1B19|nr:DUF1329 domain-containing protein [Sphaerotilus sp.]
MTTRHIAAALHIISVAMLMVCAGANAGVSADEAAKLKTELTPLGGEKAGNKDGSIPAWTGGLTTPTPGFTNGGRRPDPFAGEKPLLSITAKNMAEHAAHLTEGTKELLKRNPESFRVDVYKTHRTAAAPQWVYDNTFQNATRAKLVDGAAGPKPESVFGGVPFPIPKSGPEVMWNHLLRWRGEAWHMDFKGYQLTSDGKWVNISDASNEHWMPYYAKTGSLDKFGGEYWLVRSTNSGPPIRAGEAIVGRLNLDEEKTATWVYLTGQRRVRKLPASCCDTPGPFSAGIVSFDEVDGYTGRMDRFDWKLVGKQEIYIPYNTNRTLQPTKDSDVLGTRHLNPDHVRWELHRVWVVEANLKAGQRHTSPKSRYYVDEDSWIAVLADRWDAKGQLARMPFTLPMAMPDLPATAQTTWGVYDFLAGTAFVNVLYNDKKEHYKIVTKHPESVFTPDGMAGEGVR